MASGSQNMTTYLAKQVIGSNAAAIPEGALLQSGAGRADDSATGDTWLFLNTVNSTTNPWGVFHSQVDNKIKIIGNGTDAFWVDMDTGDTYIGGSLDTGSTLTVRAQNSTREGGEIVLSPATDSFSTIHIDAYDSMFRLHDGTNERFKVNISSGNTTINGNLGIGADYAVLGGSYKLYVNGSSYFTDTITGDSLSAWHILGGRPLNTTDFNTYFEIADNLHHDNPARTDVELTYNRFFLSHSDQTTYGPSALHLPVVDQHVLSFGIDNGAVYSRHMAFDIRTNAVYVRARTNNTWSNWEQLVRNTGTWNISITGNAATATKATQDANGYNISNSYNKKYIQIIDLTGQNVNTWYPVTITLPRDGLNRIACVTELNSGHKPSWSTHNSGYTAVVEILAVAHGWGTTNSPSICLCNDQRYIDDSTKPPVGYSQFGNSSLATFWCRGGAKYRLLSDFFDAWTTYTSSTTISNQTIAPTTTYPGISFNVSTITANITGNATTCSYPLGFSSHGSGETWGNTTGTGIAVWGTSTGGAIAFRNDNPSSGKLSIKVDGRFYGNEGTYPTMLMRNENSYWGLCDPDAANNVWIRTTTQGIIPFQSGGRGSGHCGLGTSSWYFSYAYVDTYYANRYSTGHGYINGAATNGGIDMILAGDDVWLGDCNAGGILGLKASNSTNCGLYMYNNSGTQIGQFYSANGSYFYSSKCFYAPNTASSWIDGQKYQRAALNVHTISNTGSYWPWINQINNGVGKWFSFGILNNEFYMIGSTTSRTANGYDYGLVFSIANGYLTGVSRVYNAVWNDYAEFRAADSEEPGRLVIPSNDGIAHLSDKRLQSGGRVISDTYGHAVGQSDQAKTPIGLAGRVLAYPYRNKDEYQIGDAVCSAPGGTVDVMTREEIMTYPDRIVGIVNEIPDYEVWEQTFSEQGGGGRTTQKIEVKGRIWIDIK